MTAKMHRRPALDARAAMAPDEGATPAWRPPLALDPARSRLALDATGTAYASGGRNAAADTGLSVTIGPVDGPGDVHFPIWEKHPEGDELLLVLSGAISLEYWDEEAETMTRLSPGAAFLVPAGVWHRLIVHERSSLVAVTPRRNTVHCKDVAGPRHSPGRAEEAS